MHEIRQKLNIFRPEDIVAIGYITCLTLVILIRQDTLTSFETYIEKHLIIVALYLLILWLYRRSKTGLISLARHWYPVLLFPVVYRGLEPLLYIIVPHEMDQMFINIDNLIFGCQPCLWFEGIVHPWLTEVLQISYTTYYYFPTLLGVWLYVKGKNGAYHNLLLAVSLTLYCSFIGFLLVPVLGPRFFLADMFTIPLQGKFFGPLVAQFMDISGLRGGAFPSAHSAMALITLIFAYRYTRPFFYLALPIMIGLFISTIYGRYHYVSDVLAGLILGALSSYFSPRINSWWCKRKHRTDESP
jgi:membrane-associated phospholipid phosphatase